MYSGKTFKMSEEVTTDLAVSVLEMSNLEIRRIKRAYAKSDVEFTDLFNYLVGAVEISDLLHHRKALRDSYKHTAISIGEDYLSERIESLSNKTIFNRSKQLKECRISRR